MMRLPRRTQLPAGLLSWLHMGRKWGTPLPRGCGGVCEGASGVEVIGTTHQWQCWATPSHHQEALPLPGEGHQGLVDPWLQILAQAHLWPGRQHPPSPQGEAPQRMTPHFQPPATEDPSREGPLLEGAPQPHVEMAKLLHAPGVHVSCGCHSAGTLGAAGLVPLAVPVAVLRVVPAPVGVPRGEGHGSAGRETLHTV